MSAASTPRATSAFGPATVSREPAQAEAGRQASRAVFVAFPGCDVRDLARVFAANGAEPRRRETPNT